MSEPMIWSAVLGALISLICVGGLALGMQMLTSTMMNEKIQGFERFLRSLIAALILGGQFLVAAFVIYKARTPKEHPMIFGCSLLITMLLAIVLYRAIEERGEPK